MSRGIGATQLRLLAELAALTDGDERSHGSWWLDAEGRTWVAIGEAVSRARLRRESNLSRIVRGLARRGLLAAGHWRVRGYATWGALVLPAGRAVLAKRLGICTVT